MKWADKIDMAEHGRASDEAVAHVMSPWARSNLMLRADRDFINETARKANEARDAAEPLSMSMFLSKADRLAEQQRQTAALAAEQGWR